MLLALGTTFIFEISLATAEEVVEEFEWIWAEQPILGRHNKLQFVGHRARMTLNGTIYPGQLHSKGSRVPGLITTLADLSAIANKPLPLTAGSNPTRFLGFWVIERWRSRGTVFLRGASIPRKIEFTLDLLADKLPPTRPLGVDRIIGTFT